MTEASTSAGRLNSDERVALEAALRAVHGELRAFLATLPPSAQTASGLSRLLEIERTTCQRAVSAALQTRRGLELVDQLPGVRGLRLLVEAARARAAGDPQAADALLRAVDDYERILRGLSGSRTKLLDRVRATLSGQSAPAVHARTDSEAARRALFEAAATLTGRESDVWLAAHIYAPRTGAPDQMVQVRAHGLLGHRWREDAVPLTFHVLGADHPPTPGDDAALPLGRFVPLLDGAPAGAPAEILQEFSTRPLPIVRSRQPNECIVQTIDPAASEAPGRGVDLLFGLKGAMAHPARTPAGLEEVWALINFPVRRLLLDVFLHRELARTCIPSLDVHLWRPDFASHAGERWQTRFAEGPALQVLGSDLRRIASSAYARHGELLQFLFEARGLDPADFVSMRCDVAYPIWRTGYCMSFDFGAGGA